MIEVKSPASTKSVDGLVKIFLAGSIEMGTSVDWQAKVRDALVDYNVALLNPRRDDWNSSWKQSITDPKFNEQVTWEMDNLDNADIIFMFFHGNTKSPISLLELGLHAGSFMNKIVVAEADFWRLGNIEMVCDRFSIPLYDTLEDGVEHLKNMIADWRNTRGN